MKKLLSIFLAALMLTCSIAMGQISVGAETLKGDANSDGVVNTKDVLLLRKYYVGYDVTINLTAADYNSDSKVNAKDILFVRKYLADNTGTGVDIPSDYNNVLTNSVQINQVGYDTSSSKTAKLSEPMSTASSNSNISGVTCYLINTSNNKVVYSGLSTTRSLDTKTDNTYVSTFDFSSVRSAGTYRVYAPNGYSYAFEIKDNPYKEVQDALITALYYNRCGTSLSTSVINSSFAHNVCHDGNTPVYILNKYDSSTGKYVQSSVAKASDFSGGLHDAGDYGRYTTPANQLVADLLMTYEMYGSAADCKKIPSSSSDLLAEAKYEMQWLLKMQNPSSGGVYWRIATKEFVKQGEAPDKDSNFTETGLYVSHEMLKSTAGFVGAAAMCARVYKNIDSAFATKCLNAAKKGYAYVKANMNNSNAHKAFENSSESPSVNAGAYGDNPSAWGEIWWAACELFRTTGESAYNNDVKNLYSRKTSGGISFSMTDITWDKMGGAGSFAYLNTSGADSSIKTSVLSTLKTAADNAKKISQSDKYNVTLKDKADYQWGSNFRVCLALKNMAIVDYVNKTSVYDSVIRDGISYLLGRNVVNYSYITGCGKQTPKNIWHTPSRACRSVAPGFMVGGAYQSGANYQDIYNYQLNEVCVYWNSTAVMIFGYAVNADSK